MYEGNLDATWVATGLCCGCLGYSGDIDHQYRTDDVVRALTSSSRPEVSHSIMSCKSTLLTNTAATSTGSSHR